MSGDRHAIDLVRMRRERGRRLRETMARHDLAAVLLLGRANVQYATGVAWHASDAGFAHHRPTIALVRADDPEPYVFLAEPAGAPPELAADHVHEALHPECEDGVAELARRVADVLGRMPGARIGIDEPTPAMHFRLADLLPDGEIVDAVPALAAARAVKTADEIACLRRAQEINDRAMLDVQAELRPGVRPCELTALFLERIFALGASANVVDPIWQPVPRRRADGPFTVNGEVAFPLPSGSAPLRAGDTLWVDTGISCEGYVSDFGRTWLVGTEPSPAQRALFARWREAVERVLDGVRPGVHGAQLTRAAAAGEPRRPWLEHLYLAHGAGLDSAETPLVGTDLGDAFDAAIVLEPGMVIVLEPVIWEDGVGGHRAEESIVVTEGGYERLTTHPYEPFA
jgi:Xaa-Pro aminopeptidase